MPASALRKLPMATHLGIKWRACNDSVRSVARFYCDPLKTFPREGCGSRCFRRRSGSLEALGPRQQPLRLPSLSAIALPRSRNASASEKASRGEHRLVRPAPRLALRIVLAERATQRRGPWTWSALWFLDGSPGLAVPAEVSTLAVSPVCSGLAAGGLGAGSGSRSIRLTRASCQGHNVFSNNRGNGVDCFDGRSGRSNGWCRLRLFPHSLNRKCRAGG